MEKTNNGKGRKFGWLKQNNADFGGANKEESKKVFDLYYEKGGNFIDTACSYNLGESERFLGDYVSDK
ncbi:hypothetical protein RhiirA1_481175 [Rhizophagus irregularis]|uniref:NADP-dependent oxidoreductase domain-containing protein n=1 Tax=Rhizophagus irregularis TaxID=588596 RepID=A0A2I1FN29_9GLOM|nr:hypothetical protein RhiirA1_481175 [Rhizophagus irregularis]PKY35773.1 hypothetical protein RhiirB3_457117 [Rhizophagus irregularis]